MPQAIGLLVLTEAGYAGAAGFTVFGIAGAPTLAGIIGGGSLAGSLQTASTLCRKPAQ
jgi:hypothetical protein